MAKKRTDETNKKLAQSTQFLVVVEFFLLMGYRFAEIDWLIYPLLINLAVLLTLAILAFPRLLGAVFGAIGITFLCMLVTFFVPIFGLVQSGWEPDPVIGLVVFSALLFGNIFFLVSVYKKAEAALVDRLRA